MNVSSLNALDSLERVSRYRETQMPTFAADSSNETSFDSLLSSAMNLVKQTDDYSNAVEVEEVKYAMGQSDSLHDLMVAQQKANVSLQYTVAVKNTAVEAYRTLMNMQF